MNTDFNVTGGTNLRNFSAHAPGSPQDSVSSGIRDIFTSAVDSGFTGKASLIDIGSIFGKPDANRAILDNAFKSAEELIAKSKDGDIQKDASNVTRELFGKIGEYASATGKKAEEVANDVKDFAISHPAVSITLLLACGITIGVLLEKFSVPSTLLSGTTDSLSAVGEQIRKHPFIAAGIGVALAGTIAYLTSLVLTSPAMKHPSADTPEKQKLDASLDALEQKAAHSLAGDPKQDAKSISDKFFSTVSDYAKATGKTVSEAASDVKDFMMAHPGVTAAVILSAGTATGIILQKARVPDKMALLAGTAFDAAGAKAKNGISELTGLIRENPVITAVVVSALAAGAGYLAYEYLSK